MERIIIAEKMKETKDKNTRDISKETQRLVDFLNEKYNFRFNSVMGYTEYQDKSFNYMDWTPLDKRVLMGMAMESLKAGINARENDVRRYVQSNLIPEFDPVGEYIWAQRGKWDGKDYIRELARRVPTKNPHWEDWFYTWFLAMVRQWRVGNVAKYGNQAVPLLISEQGWNKTTFCEMLLPPELSFGYTGNLQLSNKNLVFQQMAQMLLINLDEFNQISPRVQQGFLKNIITLSSVKTKRPYGRHVEDFPRRASFIATTNETKVLADPTGSRRFLAVQLTGPIDVSTRPNYEQLYAQAMDALHEHVPTFFNEEQTKQIVESNRRFCEKTAAEMFFLDHFEPAADDKEGEWMTATAILEYLKSEVGISLLQNISAVAFGRRLTHMGNLTKDEKEYGNAYLVKRKKR